MALQGNRRPAAPPLPDPPDEHWRPNDSAWREGGGLRDLQNLTHLQQILNIKTSSQDVVILDASAYRL